MPRGRKPGAQKRPQRVAPPVALKPPAGLDDLARQEFGRLVAALGRAGTLDRADQQHIADAARVGALIERAYQELAEGPLTSMANNGIPMAHPMLSVLNTLVMRRNTLMLKLGLTPETAKLGDGGDTVVPGADKWSALLNVAG